MFSFLFRYFRRYFGWAALAVLATLFYASSTVSLVYLIEPLFGEVLMASGEEMPEQVKLVRHGKAEEPGQESTPAAPDLKHRARLWLKRSFDRGFYWLRARFGIDDARVVYFIPALFLLLFLVRAFSDFVNGYAFQEFGLRGTNALRNDLFRRVLAQSSSFHARHASGEVISRIVSDIAVIQTAISNRIADLFQQSLTLVVLLWVLFSKNSRLAAVCLIGAPAVIYPIVRFGRGLRHTTHRSQERMADLSNLVAEAVRGHRVVKAFGMEEFENRRFAEVTRSHLRVTLRGQLFANLSSPVVESVAVLGAALLFAWAGKTIRAGGMSTSDFFAFLVNLLMLYDPVRKLNRVNLVVQQSLAAVQRARSLFQVPIDIMDRPGARDWDGTFETLAFEDVRFAYREGEEVLRGVSLPIRRGETVALVGASGAGKSTLASLLPRFYDVTEGRVAIDGTDIRDLSLASLRGGIGLVTQETYLFDDTIRNNIAYGRADLPLERVREAARAAFADEFILAMPQGYDTRIGEGGMSLSGGQRQRLAIARALLKDAPVLILDEATSQLDMESEALVQKALANLVRGRTTLVIAHRLTTIQSADRIVVMERGEIVEEGSHQEMLARGGLYRRLHDLQFHE